MATLKHVRESPFWQLSLFCVLHRPPYAVEIEEGLKRGLTELGYIEGENTRYLTIRIVASYVVDSPDTQEHVHTILEAGLDIIATIGTQASTPAWPIVEKSALPMVFAGVTHPIKEGLIGTFGKPITGISYGAPVHKRVEVICELFPGKNRFKRLAFVYSWQVSQELDYVNNLKALGTVAHRPT